MCPACRVCASVTKLPDKDFVALLNWHCVNAYNDKSYNNFNN